MSRLWYDPRVRGLLMQVALVGGFAALVAWLAANTVTNLARRGIAVGFDFLDRTARFPISESIVPYRPTDSFAHAILVGLVNSLFVAALVIVAATALGLVVGLARRSAHPLASGCASVFVDVMRNTPLIVQLLFWYALVTVGLPSARQALNPLPGVFLSLRGLFVPGIVVEGSLLALFVSLLSGLALLTAGVWLGHRRRVLTGRSNRLRWIVLAIVLVGLPLVWFLLGLSLRLDMPRLQGFNFAGGVTLTPEFFTIAVGLTLYSAAFIGEIIRGGIDGVGRGQWEAGRAVGLPERHILRLVVIPQALRIIIPPMTSQYFNIVKNTTLALIVGYPDISYVIATTINQTGQAIEGVAILMGIFLSISVVVSLAMNWYNRRVALVTR
jgi:general L-amino acid transport system permease protein